MCDVKNWNCTVKMKFTTDVKRKRKNEKEKEKKRQKNERVRETASGCVRVSMVEKV